MHIAVSERFLSIQGEGPSAGEPAYFLRLAGCNLACVWCDTPYSWDWKTYDRASQVETMDVLELAEKLGKDIPAAVSLLVVTGGEPLLQASSLLVVLSRLRDARPDVRVEMETNGTIRPREGLVPLIHLFVVSPKLLNAGELNVVSPRQVAQFRGLRAILKVVVLSSDDVKRVGELARESGFEPARVWISPEGTTPETIRRHARQVVEAAVSNGFHMSSRLQVVIWGDERGR